ncbi:DUF436 family protein [Oceanithermus sp.]|uniref:DUF436 family protein n=1 Tax=Oceanithermus sp. TaxID=2268145 RepID=UPI00257E2402|nr:DUF436 family protein [Oceanithermus sp.]
MPSELAAPLIEAVRRIFAAAPPEPGDLMVLGGSTSAVRGERYGKAGDPALAQELLEALLPELAPRGVVLAVQGCEHVNRSLVLPADRARLLGLEPVNVVPVPKAGGALAAVYRTLLPDPAVVADLAASARYGLDIGGVLIGMHLRPVVVPVPLGDLRLGHAPLSGGFSRPRLIGGARAVYDPAEADRILEEALRNDEAPR